MLAKRFTSFVLVFAPVVCLRLMAATATTTSLAVPASPIDLPGGTVPTGALATLSATVSASGEAVSPGLVTFFDGKFPLGFAQLNKAGIATLNVVLGIGSHSITAGFAGTHTFAASQSASQSVSVSTCCLTQAIDTIGFSGANNNYTLTGQSFAFSWTPPSGQLTFVDNTNGNTIGNVTLGAGFQAFVPQFLYQTDPVPLSVAPGDFNGDGVPDLAVASAADNTINIFLGIGDGTLRFQQTIRIASDAVGIGLSSVVVADFNGDGFADIAVANPTFGTVSVLLGSGDGNFGAPQTVSGGSPHALVVGDFNGDGLPDLAAANSGNVSVYLNNGSGGLLAPVTYSVNGMPTQLTVGDFNGDGRADLAVANGGVNYCGPTFPGCSTVSILINTGSGFQTLSPLTVGNSPQGIVAQDFDGDGILDLATANYNDGTVSVLIGKGGGAFKPQVVYPVGTAPQGLVAADFNGDGNWDLAVSNNPIEFVRSGEGSVGVLTGTGAGTFTDFTSYPTGLGSPFVALTDLNGDGLPDLAVSNSFQAGGVGGYGALDNMIGVLLNSTSAKAPSLANVSIPGSTMQSVYAYLGGEIGASPTIGLTPHSIRQLTVSVPSFYLGDVWYFYRQPHLDFGIVGVNSTSPMRTFTISNTGLDEIDSLSISIAGLSPTMFGQTSNCGTKLTAGASCTVEVTYTPKFADSFNAVLEVHSDAPNAPLGVVLTGTAPGVRSLAYSRGLLVFTSNETSQDSENSLLLTNSGSEVVSGLSIGLGGANPDLFSVASTCGSTLEPGVSCTVNLTFYGGFDGDPELGAPLISGTATLLIQSNAVASPGQVPLLGQTDGCGLMGNPCEPD
jgi:FG-GAP-like repeat/Bacterial Ig-like domain (group 3)